MHNSADVEIKVTALGVMRMSNDGKKVMLAKAFSRSRATVVSNYDILDLVFGSDAYVGRQHVSYVQADHLAMHCAVGALLNKGVCFAGCLFCI